MYLGLDLRGGVHFLLQVDMKAALDKAADRYTTDIRSLLREKKVQYAGVAREGHERRRPLPRRRGAHQGARRDREGVPATSLLREADAAAASCASSARSSPRRRSASRTARSSRTSRSCATASTSSASPSRSSSSRAPTASSCSFPGVQDTARAKDILGRTATLEIRMVNDEPGALEAALAGQVPFGSDLFTERSGGPVLVRRQVVLTGDRINDAQPGFDQRNNEPAVHVNLDGTGARIFKEVTRENVGKRMAIVLVEKGKAEVITAPVIREEIGGGRVQISGRMNTREANDIALLMRAGALAAPMEIVEERTVGPSLGKENIDKGFNSVFYGFIVLAIFMCAYYLLMGVISTIALSVNLLLLVALLSMLQATLTLPGIAAIALTLGMAIDSNVLINERIREELRWGATPHAALTAGYERAFGTILDSNVTTLIAGIALLIFGSGPVRGFAVVHCLGIMTSMFSAVFVSRGIVNLIYGGRKHLTEDLDRPGLAAGRRRRRCPAK